MNVGVVVVLRKADEIDGVFKKAHDFGFKYCQLICWNKELFNQECANAVLAALAKYDLKISTFWCGWSGPRVWNFYEGQTTLGLVPEEYRAQRVADLRRGAEFAARMGASQMATHAGFLPENPNDPCYEAVVNALRNVAEHAQTLGVKFLFETGQETPTTLRRVMEDIGTDNLGVNYDPANLILYGKANPTDALSILGPYICDVHAKDGLYPTDGRSLGHETRLGVGNVDFAALIGYLKQRGYTGAITIEREISGEQQIADIRHAYEMLSGLIVG